MGTHSPSKQSRHRDWHHNRTEVLGLGWPLELEREQHGQQALAQPWQRRTKRRKGQRATKKDVLKIVSVFSIYWLTSFIILTDLVCWRNRCDVFETIADWDLMLTDRAQSLFIPETDSHDLFMKTTQLTSLLAHSHIRIYFTFIWHTLYLKSC